MLELDYTSQGRRPSTRQIIRDWEKNGSPREFQVNYGETFAEFTYDVGWKWVAHGNGCNGFKRDEVLKELNRIES